MLVLRDTSTANGIRFRRLVAEHSCCVRRQDIEDAPKFVRALNSHPATRKAVWEGDWLRICWTGREALRHYVKRLQASTDEKPAIPTYEGMVSPVLRHMVDNDLRPGTPRRVWVDLETDSRVPFTQAIEGEARVLSWATEDAATGDQRSAVLEVDTDEAERVLLLALWDVLDHYDQVLAWGGDRFDFPIIKARSERCKLLSPAEREWRRWLWLDHLELYRRMNMQAAESGDEKTSMALGAVAMALLGVGKDDFEADQTWEAWAAGGESRARLLKYNIQDTALMLRIEAKTGYVMLLQTVADTCGTFPDSRGSNPSVQVEGFLARLAHKRGYKFPTVLKVGIGEPYEGAYVKHPEKRAGVHTDVHVADFAAYYPTIIRTWNISPETIVEQPGRFPCSYSPLTKTYFRTDIPGILPEAVKQLMELRAEWNTKKLAVPPGTDAWKDADRRTTAYKITANSFYGVIGAPTSRHYNRDVAEAVTQVAKWCIEETIKAASLRGIDTIYADTDSMFAKNASREAFEAFVAQCNAELYPRIVAEQGCVQNHIKLAYEKQFARLIFTTAKRYVGSLRHYKGIDADANSRPEIKGLEYKRGDSLRVTRRMQEEVANRLVGYKSDADPDDVAGFEEVVERWMVRCLNDPFEADDIVVSKRLNKPLDEYKVANPMVRIAREMQAKGEDVAEGARISYVVLDAAQSPQLVQRVEQWDPTADSLDRVALWDRLIWPSTERLLEAAFPQHSWARFAKRVKLRKAAERTRAKMQLMLIGN